MSDMPAGRMELPTAVTSRWALVALMIATLAASPPSAWGQPGGGREIGPGPGPDDAQTMQRMMERMMQPQERTRRPTAPAASRRPETGATQGTRPVPVEDSVAVPPVYRQPVFVVLVAVGASATGAAAFYAVRFRSRRRRGAASFVTEAVLVVDIVGSTQLATHYGDGLAMKARTIFKDRAMTAAERNGLTFAENTGDGYFMTFPSVVGAIRTAIAVLEGLRDQPPDLSPAPPLAVRAAATYGEILLDARGTRHGAVINKAFRLEGLAGEHFTERDAGVEGDEIPDRDRIFLDEDAVQEARAAGVTVRDIGVCRLKGFSGLHRVYEVLWAPNIDAQGRARGFREKRR